MASKDAIRQRLKERLAAAGAGHSVCERLVEFLRGENVGPLAVYGARLDEISLDRLFKTQDFSGPYYYPRVEGSDLQFYEVADPDHLEAGAFGLKEPNPRIHTQRDLAQVQAVLVPGVAFDRTGFRLGRGKGFYDRILKDFCGAKIGVCHGFQVLDELPVEPHDVAMDFVVTEKFVLRPLKRTKRKGEV